MNNSHIDLFAQVDNHLHDLTDRQLIEAFTIEHIGYESLKTIDTQDRPKEYRDNSYAAINEYYALKQAREKSHG